MSRHLDKYLTLCAVAALAATATAQTPVQTDSTLSKWDEELDEVSVVTRNPGTLRMAGPENGLTIGKAELFKAACCNLGESFVTNPSVDVNYSDAATGAKQIRLLGLSGTYVQMLTENLPNFRGASIPYALGYVPGPWMKSIQVSKGASSVRNGYESITGQINVQYLQPEDEEGITANFYANTMSKIEANADANVHLSPLLSTEILAHYDYNWSNHDGNGDTFLDQPQVRQYNFQNRWAYLGSKYIFHGGISLIKEDRDGGQTTHHASARQTDSAHGLYRIGIQTDRYEGYMKHAFVLDPEHGTNVALMGSVSMHLQDATYGHKTYRVNEKNAYAQLMFETNFTDAHTLSAGLSYNHDYFGQRYRLEPQADASRIRDNEVENVYGVYAQYTYNLHERLVAMAGLRIDHSDEYSTFVTPRFHLKWTATDWLTLRGSAGKGYRTVHALAENNYLLSSGRTLVIDPLSQEEAWNYGLSTQFYIPLFGQTLKLNAEYYYTDFRHQAVIDYDTDPALIRIADLDGDSYSHTFQIDATYPLFKGMTVTAAWRWNDVKTPYGGRLLRKPLTNRYKGLLTASYKTPLELWQFDATLQLNGSGRMPTPYTLADGTPSWSGHYHGFAQLSAQVTRWFRHFSIYAGGENLTAYRQKHPVIGWENPWSSQFDPTLVWGPVEGAMFYAGIRVNIGRL